MIRMRTIYVNTTCRCARSVELLRRITQDFARDDQALHLACSFVDVEDPGVAKRLLDRIGRRKARKRPGHRCRSASPSARGRRPSPWRWRNRSCPVLRSVRSTWRKTTTQVASHSASRFDQAVGRGRHARRALVVVGRHADFREASPGEIDRRARDAERIGRDDRPRFAEGLQRLLEIAVDMVERGDAAGGREPGRYPRNGCPSCGTASRRKAPAFPSRS